MADNHSLSFGPYQLDLTKEQLWCEAQPVRLTPKAFQVLCYLAGRPGQVVTKDELFRVAWPDTVVGDAALTMCIQEIRKALHDQSRSPQYVETVHRRGFRFIGTIVSSQQEERQKPALSEVEGTNGKNQKPVLSEVEGATDGYSLVSSVQSLEPKTLSASPEDIQTLDPRRQTLDPPPPTASHLWPSRGFVLAAVLLLTVTVLTVQYLSRPTLSTQDSALRTEEAKSPSLPLPDKPSLIMLPLVNLSGDPEQEYFSDGLTEVLTGALSKISGLFVIARNSAFTYKGKATKVQEVGREMGVRYVLEGSVQRSEQRVRIAVQLIDATIGYHLWSEQYDRPLADIFALQDEIVQKIVTTLKLQLTLEEQGYIVRKHTDNVEAYDAFLRGVEHHFLYTKEDNLRARQWYEQALALDPQYAEAYEWLSMTYLTEWVSRWSTDPQILERASALAHKSVALDDALPDAHWGLCNIYAMTQRYEQALAEGERAIALDPNNADSYQILAQALVFAGRPEDALRMMAQATRLNPRYPPHYSFVLGVAYRLTGRHTEAIATLQDVIRQSPNFSFAYMNLALSYLWQWLAQQSPAGQTLKPALAAVQQALALNDSLYWNHQVLGAISLYQQQYEQALAEMERAVALAPTEAQNHAALAEVLSRMGRTADALEAAAQALRLKPGVVDGHLANVGAAYAIAGRYEEARAPLERYLSRYPNLVHAHLMLAFVDSELGQDAEAQKEAAEVLRLNPRFSLEVHKQRMPIKDPAVLERLIVALRKAGLK